ncbi:MAG: hypothetical protein WEG36_13960 [Gemmatimonadota bacterium]
MRGKNKIKGVAFAGAALLATTAFAPGASAQLGSGPGAGDEIVNFAIHFGMLAPVTKFDDPTGGQSSLESGAAFGASATVWPYERIGLRAKVMRSSNSGTNDEFPFAALAVQEATQWMLTGEVVARQTFDTGSFSGFPYIAAGVGGKQYYWSNALHDEERYFVVTGAGGVEVRHASLGRFGFNAEVRAYRSNFNSFGINGGNWRVGTPANPIEPVGFYGGVTDDVTNWDVMFTTGVSMTF